jgi:hypothetical protein
MIVTALYLEVLVTKTCSIFINKTYDFLSASCTNMHTLAIILDLLTKLQHYETGPTFVLI